MNRRALLIGATATATATAAAGAAGPAVAVAEELPGRQERATYHSGNMYHFRAAGNQKYLDHTARWAESHRYGPAGGAGTRNADNQCAGQAHLDLYEVLGAFLMAGSGMAKLAR
jgi:rhamnogalacturonyl hydrolase YesR